MCRRRFANHTALTYSLRRAVVHERVGGGDAGLSEGDLTVSWYVFISNERWHMLHPLYIANLDNQRLIKLDQTGRIIGQSVLNGAWFMK